MNKGLTFVELLLVIAIILTLSVLSTTFYARFFNQNAVANTVDQLVGDFRKAQTYSLVSRQGSMWGVRYGSDTITLFKGPTYALRTTAFDENFSVPSSVSVSGFSEVSFRQGTGTPSATSTITISSTGSSETITINAQGGISR